MRFLFIFFSPVAESALDAVEAGVDGILVSAHGGRQLDGAPAPVSSTIDSVVGFMINLQY